MNIVQEIIALLLKGKYFAFFKNSMTPREVNFMEFFTVSYFSQSVEIKNYQEGLIMVWNYSNTIRIACLVDQRGFSFSTPMVYDEEELQQYPVSKIPNGITRRNVISQIEEVKTMFLQYSVDAEVYFK